MVRVKRSRKPNRRGNKRSRKVARVAVVANPGLQKVVNYHSSTIRALITDNMAIQSNSGSPSITFSGAASYYNWNNLFSLIDFTDNSNYRFVKIHSITLDIERSVDEATIFSQLDGNYIFVNAYPELYSATIPASALARDQYSYKVDTMTFEHQRFKMPMVNIQMYDTQATPIYLNPSKSMPYSEVQYYPGQFSIGSDKVTNAPTTQKLFSVKILYLVTFFGRT